MISQRYVALLRGINVGRAKRIAMADLRTLVESLGYTGVRSLLNSGNVVFDAGSAADGTAAAAALGKGLGDGTTSRNWKTITKLHGLCSDSAHRLAPQSAT